MIELWRREVAGRTVTVVVTERSDGDMHPINVAPATLAARQLAATLRPWLMVDQVHGVAAHRVSAEVRAGTIAGVGDVISAEQPERAIAIWAADCAPLVLIDAAARPIGCHAGWRGLAAGVVDVALAQATGRVSAVLGPCVHPCCYEFGEPELEAVAQGIGVDAASISAVTANGALALDVPGAVRAALARHDVELEVIGACTACDGRWFSHRRGDAERHAVVAWSMLLP